MFKTTFLSKPSFPVLYPLTWHKDVCFLLKYVMEICDESYLRRATSQAKRKLEPHIRGGNGPERWIWLGGFMNPVRKTLMEGKELPVTWEAIIQSKNHMMSEDI